MRPPNEPAVTQYASHSDASLNAFPFACWVSDAEGRWISVNAALTQLTGQATHELLGTQWLESVHPDDQARVLVAQHAAISRHQPYKLRYQLQRPDGSYRWVLDHAMPRHDAGGQCLGFAGILIEMQENTFAEAELAYQTYYDRLTGLPNLSLLRDRLTQAIAVAARERQVVALLLFNIDEFKLINDSLGRDAGDRLLQALSERLQLAIRDCDTVARSEGSEFAVLLSAFEREEAILPVAEKLQGQLDTPFQLDGRELFVSCSVGIACYPKDGDNAAVLLACAGVALHRTKAEGRGRLGFFSREMLSNAQEQLALGAGLRTALERGEFETWYQPQVDLRTGLITGVEALIRWRHPELGLVPPAKFIPVAEASRLIVPIGEWVLREACQQAAAWAQAGLPPLTVAVNLSAQQLHQPGPLLLAVKRALADTGLDGNQLELELTESMIIDQPEQLIPLLSGLEMLGVKLAIDDFGTGYSSLSYLKRLPLYKIKIDQSFVRDMTVDPDSAAITRSIISIARDMHKRVIAEGVETEAQALFLQRHGCDEIQGYLFSRPLPVAEMTGLLAEARRLQLPDGNQSVRTLLLVDDDIRTLAALARSLRHEGYRLLQATHMNEALELLAREGIGVILSDQRMPGGTGVELLWKARQLYPQTVRILLSGHASLNTLSDAINDGAAHKFLFKPWEDEVLKARLREAFELYEQHRHS
ncbi:EAL domain-containing protein [Andreprevotia chitinilytica]|uniref:EAL domain-containing protein n=1 Tax=Andreprevotia chitinilytica TaxID=396808 RepID=UPI00068AB734|nr:EAL domain-containing protein [Andreprevotia chitinilytica]